MDKRLLGVFFPLIIVLGALGYSFAMAETSSLSVVYLVEAVVSVLLLGGCCLVVKKKKKWFIMLFTSVSVVNLGYAFLAVSPCLENALWANRISYLGSVFLPFAMLMIISEATNTKIKKWVSVSLLVVAIGVFFIAASPGILDIYYKEVSFSVVNGVSTLVKVYGPLHPLYMIYLLGYFSSMIFVIIRSSVKKTIDTTSHALILLIAVFVNICVWFIEQVSSIDFEFLSVSYIISELFLLGVHLVTNENEFLKAQLKAKEEELALKSDTPKTEKACEVSREAMEIFCRGFEKLTPTERLIYQAYLCGTPSKEVMTQLNIKENTLKFHNKNIYGKLGVPSRKRLLEVYGAIKEERNQR